MERYIDATTLSKTVFESMKENPHTDGIVRRTHHHEHEHFLRMIDNVPTADVVKVVRCCDCKHRQENPDINNTCFLTCNLKYGLQGTIDPTDFCSYGKKED